MSGSSSSRWLAGLLALAILGVLTVYFVSTREDDDAAPEASEPEEDDGDRERSVGSSSSERLSVREEDGPRRAAPARVIVDAGVRLAVSPLAVGPPRGAEVGSTAPPVIHGPPTKTAPAEPAEIPPEVLLRRTRGVQNALEERLSLLQQQREEAVAAGDTARLARIDYFIERLERQRPEVEQRIRELERASPSAERR